MPEQCPVPAGDSPPAATEPTALVPAASPAAAAAGPARGRRPGRVLLAAALAVGVTAASFGFALPRLASYGSAWASLRTMHWPGLVLIAAAFAVSQAATWAMIAAVLPSLRMRQAAAVNLGSSAVANTLPAGGAVAMGVSWAMLSSWGVGTAEYIRYTLVSGLWNVFVRLGLPAVALSVLAVAGGAGAGSQAAAFAGACVLAGAVAGLWAMLRSEGFTRRTGELLAAAAAGFRLLRRPATARIPGALLDFRAGAAGLLAQRGLRITVTTVASHVSLWLVLLACLRAGGLGQGQVPWQSSLAAFAFARLLSVLPITPGGVGVVEVGLTAPLVAGLAPAAAGRVAAAVLMFRAVTYLLPLPLGAAAYLWWRWARPQRKLGT
ncbi:MAG: flippase-like domain-containing protein [Actinobacteria bacterium]|nr:flippase-like domain-containing protein [Actinomycetota bacterium]